jgi:hypothetical protein
VREKDDRRENGSDHGENINGENKMSIKMKTIFSAAFLLGLLGRKDNNETI